MKNVTTKTAVLIAILFTALLSGCGSMERLYDSENYESLTNETGTAILYSGGVEVGEYKNATILYASSDTEAVWFRDSEGNAIYWQGTMKFLVR